MRMVGVTNNSGLWRVGDDAGCSWDFCLDKRVCSCESVMSVDPG